MSKKQTALEILHDAKQALNHLASLIKKIEDAINEESPISAQDDPPGGNSPEAPDIP